MPGHPDWTVNDPATQRTLHDADSVALASRPEPREATVERGGLAQLEAAAAGASPRQRLPCGASGGWTGRLTRRRRPACSSAPLSAPPDRRGRRSLDLVQVTDRARAAPVTGVAQVFEMFCRRCGRGGR